MKQSYVLRYRNILILRYSMDFDNIVIGQVFIEYRIEKYVIFNDKDVEERG